MSRHCPRPDKWGSTGQPDQGPVNRPGTCKCWATASGAWFTCVLAFGVTSRAGSRISGQPTLTLQRLSVLNSPNQGIHCSSVIFDIKIKLLHHQNQGFSNVVLANFLLHFLEVLANFHFLEVLENLVLIISNQRNKIFPRKNAFPQKSLSQYSSQDRA